MKSSANLEVNVYRRSEGSYSIILRCTPPGGEVDISRAGEAQVDFERLRASAQDTLSYATLLTRDLFKDPVVARAFGEARSTAQVLNASLRIQLDIASNAPELQTLHWETLLDPRDGSYLFAGEQISFFPLSEQSGLAAGRSPRANPGHCSRRYRQPRQPR